MKKLISIFIMVCMLASSMAFMPQSAFAAAANSKAQAKTKWTDSFVAIQGDITVDSKNDTATLKSESSTKVAAQYWCDTKLSNEFFDIEWEMTMKNSANGINVQARTGSKRIYLDFKKDSIQPMGASRINVDLGVNVSHTYRLTWEDGMGSIYVDDEFVSSFVLSESGMQRGFGFYVNGTYGDTDNIITNVTIFEDETEEVVSNETEQKSEYIPNYNYMQEFDDPNCVQGEEWKNSYETGIKIENGLLSARCDGGGGFIRHWFGTPSNFTAEMKIRIESTGDSINYIITWPSHRITMQFMAQEFKANGAVVPGVEIIDGEWHIVKTIGYNDGQSVAIYIDGELVWAGAPTTDSPTVAREAQWHLNFSGYHGTSGENCVADVDYIHVTGTDASKQPTLQKPMSMSEYLQGEKVPLKASVPEGSDAKKVLFTLNGNVIAEAEAPDFETSVTNLAPGKYKLAALTEKGDASSPLTVTVRAAARAELKIDKAGQGVNLKTSLFDRYGKVDAVEYFVDGVSVGRSSAKPNYAVKVASIAPLAHKIAVRAYDANGTILASDSEDYMSDVNTNLASENYMNELSYTVSGTSGSATYTFSNGNHKVQLRHTANGVAYLTDEGEKTFSLGTGDFKILTDGATADVYRNGQMAFSYYLPMTTERGRKVSENGMKITNVVTKIPEGMKTYYQGKNITGHGVVSYFDELHYYNITEFVANKSDNFRIILCDGWYRMDVELKDGKFYVRKTDKDASEPYSEEVCDAKEGDAYYRIETAAGAVRLYGNGRWMTTFRGEHAEGDTFLAVNAEKPIKFLSVHDNRDLYFYEDDFSGSGENESADFWMYANTEPYILDGIGMIVDGLGSKDAIAEISAYAGDFELEADVKILKNKGGAYFLLNRAVTSIYSKIGYNFETKQFELVDRSGSSYAVKKSAKGEMPVGETVNMRLKVSDSPSGKTATLFVNGKEVLSCEDGLVMEVRGRCGFVMDDNAMTVEHVSYRGDAYVNIGMYDVVMNLDNTDVLEFDDKLILTNGSNRGITTDGGKTWTFESAPSFESYNLLQVRDKNGNPTGKILSMNNKQVGANEEGKALKSVFCSVSTDGGNSYRELSRVTPEGNTVCGAMPNRLTQGPSGRIYFPDCVEQNESGGITDIYYSDDEGATWTKSETKVSYYNTGFVIAENVIIEMGNGMTRMYSRTDLGQIIYFESSDRGKTWDLTAHSTPLLSATNCYNIVVDPYSPNTLYAAWGYDNANLNSTVQNPRTRFGVAMSPDCGETWHYIGTAHENNGTVNAMMNLSIDVTKDYLIVGQGIHADHHNYVGNSDGVRDVFIPKAKIKPLMDFEQVHMRWDWMENVRMVSVSNMTNTLIVNPTDGNVLLYGKELVENAAYDNMISADCAARWLGGTVDVSNGSVVFKTGDETVTVPSDMTSVKDGKKYVSIDYIAEICDIEVSEYEDIRFYDKFGILTENLAVVYRAMTQLFYDNADAAK